MTMKPSKRAFALQISMGGAAYTMRGTTFVICIKDLCLASIYANNTQCAAHSNDPWTCESLMDPWIVATSCALRGGSADACRTEARDTFKALIVSHDATLAMHHH